MDKRIKQLQEQLAFELRSEKHLVDNDFKNCECGIYVDRYCLVCGKKKETPQRDVSKLN